MTIDRDPPRLLSQPGVHDGLKQALHTAANDAPSAAHLEAMLAAVPISLPIGGAGVPTAQATVSNMKLAGKLLWLKLGGVLVITMGSLTWLLTSPGGREVHERAAVAERVRGAAQESRLLPTKPGSKRAAPVMRDSLKARAGAPAGAAHVSPAASGGSSLVAEDSSPPAVATLKPEPPRAQAAKHPAAHEHENEQQHAQQAKLRAAPGVRNAREIVANGRVRSGANSERVRKPSRESAQPGEDVTTTELQWIERAQLALVRAPALALRLLEEHRARFPNGVFSEEREVLQMDALSALGRTDEARASAKRFLARYPQSLHRAHAEDVAR